MAKGVKSKHARVLSSSLNTFIYSVKYHAALQFSSLCSRHGLTEHSQQKHASVQDCAFHCISWNYWYCAVSFSQREMFSSSLQSMWCIVKPSCCCWDHSAIARLPCETTASQERMDFIEKLLGDSVQMHGEARESKDQVRNIACRL